MIPNTHQNYNTIQQILSDMNQNPQKAEYFKQYCKKHPACVYEYICDREKCDYYLSFQCHQCRQENIAQHSHQCMKVPIYVQKLHEQVIEQLSSQMKHNIDEIQKLLIKQLNAMKINMCAWFSPMDQTSTEKQFVHTVQNPSKWNKIKQTSELKTHLINARLRQLYCKFRKQMEQITKIVQSQMKELKYHTAPIDWKFDRANSHELVNISGFKDKTIDKKSDKQKFCVAILNQPLTPLKNQINFTINSQNAYDHYIALGLCSKRQLTKCFYQTDLKSGLYAIYQASKSGSYNNAYSLHCSDNDFHFKQTVGWNFRSGDVINVNLSLTDSDKVRIQFKKKKQTFQFLVPKSESFLHPFVALISAGDKVSISNA